MSKKAKQATELAAEVQAGLTSLDTTKSGTSDRVYTAIAKNGETTLKVNVQYTDFYTKFPKGARRVVGVQLRSIEEGPRAFMTFPKRTAFGLPKGFSRHMVLAVPIAFFPCQPHDLVRRCAEQGVTEKLVAFLKKQVEVAGGKMVVGDDLLTMLVTGDMGELNGDAPELFMLPETKLMVDAPEAPAVEDEGEEHEEGEDE